MSLFKIALYGNHNQIKWISFAAPHKFFVAVEKMKLAILVEKDFFQIRGDIDIILV